MSVLADTGALYALHREADGWHERMRGWVSRSGATLLVPATVVQETAYMISARVGPLAEASFLRTAAEGEYTIADLDRTDLLRAADLVGRYADFPLGFVDASIVAIAERLDIRDLLTTDRRHFGVIRPAHCERLRLLP